MTPVVRLSIVLACLTQLGCQSSEKPRSEGFSTRAEANAPPSQTAPSPSSTTPVQKAPAEPKTLPADPRNWDRFVEHSESEREDSPRCRKLHKKLPGCRCWNDGKSGAWTLRQSPPGDGESDPLLAEDVWLLEHHADGGSAISLKLEAAVVDSLGSESPLLVDFDDDGRREVLWMVAEHPSVGAMAWTRRGQTIRRVSEMKLDGTIFRLTPQTGRWPAAIHYHLDLGPSSECDNAIVEVEHDTTEYSPGLIAHVVGGKLVADSDSARVAARAWCPAPPTTWHTAQQVMCAKLWGRDSKTLLAQIEERFAEGSCEEPASLDEPTSGATMEFHPMRIAARWKPPFVFPGGASLFKAIPAKVLDGSLESACGEEVFVPDAERSHKLDLPQPVEPYRELRLLTCRNGPFVSERVVIATSTGRYTSPQIFRRSEAGSGYRSGGWTISRLALEQVVPGGPPELVGYVTGSTMSGGASPEFFESSSEELFVCRLAGSGAPECTQTFSSARRYRGDDGRADYRLTVEFVAGGLSISGDSRFPDVRRRSLVHHLLK